MLRFLTSSFGACVKSSKTLRLMPFVIQIVNLSVDFNLLKVSVSLLGLNEKPRPLSPSSMCTPASKSSKSPLPKDMQYFWDNVFIDGMAGKLSHIIGTFNGGISSRGSVFYNDEQLFELLKSKLLAGDFQINYENAELGDFSKKANGDYDLILLSNIIDYFSSAKEEKYFKKAIKSLYEQHLNPEGLLQITSSLTNRNMAYRIMQELGLKYFKVENGGFDYHDAIMIKKPSQETFEK